MFFFLKKRHIILMNKVMFSKEKGVFFSKGKVFFSKEKGNFFSRKSVFLKKKAHRYGI